MGLITRQNVTAPKLTASRNEKIAGSIIIGHDGSVWFVSVKSQKIAAKLEKAYNTVKDEVGDRAEIVALDWFIDRAKKEGFVWEHLR